MAFLTVFVAFGVVAWIGAIGLVSIQKKANGPTPRTAFKLDRAGTACVASLAGFWGPVLLFIAAHVIFQLPYSEQASSFVATIVVWVGVPLTLTAAFILIRKIAHWAGNRFRELAK